MSKSSYVAAAIAFAFSGAALANDPAAPKSGSSAASQQPALNTAAQCETLVGDKKEQCMRQAQQTRGGTATGGTSGAGAAGAGASPPRSTGASGGEAGSGKARPY
jgi:hypothetical protein